MQVVGIGDTVPVTGNIFLSVRILSPLTELILAVSVFFLCATIQLFPPAKTLFTGLDFNRLLSRDVRGFIFLFLNHIR